MFSKYIKFQDGNLWKRSGSGWETLNLLDILEEIFFGALLFAGMIALIAVDIVLILLIKGLLSGGVS